MLVQGNNRKRIGKLRPCQGSNRPCRDGPVEAIKKSEKGMSPTIRSIAQVERRKTIERKSPRLRSGGKEWQSKKVSLKSSENDEKDLGKWGKCDPACKKVRKGPPKLRGMKE